MSDDEHDSGRAPGFDERAPWVILLADGPDEDDDEANADSVGVLEFDDVGWR